MAENLPIVVGPFVIPRSTVEGHDIRLIIEDGAQLGRCEGSDVIRPWLRPSCSCGWVGEDHFTIEDNAYWLWGQHINPDEAEARG